MFKKICIKHSGDGFSLDIGFLAEAMLFYEEVILIVNPGILPKLLDNCDFPLLKDLIERKVLRLCILKSILGVSTAKNQGYNIHNVDSWTMDDFVEKTMFRGLYKQTGRRGYSKRLTDQLLQVAKTVDYDKNVSLSTKNDLLDTRYTKEAICASIKALIPDIAINPDEINYEIIDTGNGFIFNSNLNYEELTKSIPNRQPGHIINPEKFIGNILETRGDLHIASEFGAEMATSQINTLLMKHKFSDIWNKINTNRVNISQFTDFTLSNGNAIKEAINDKNKTFKDFIQLLDKADKFKSWLQNMNGDTNIIKEYFRAVTEKTWVESLPIKMFRWSLFTALGIWNPALGISLGLGDTFLIDKISSGWKPNIFVENHLKKFVQKK